MSESSGNRRQGSQILQLPNLLTIARFILCIVLFVLIFASQKYTGERGWFIAALSVFIVAGLTDLLDGHIARKYGMETTFGRFADPLVDKILICGTYIFLVQYLPGDPYMKESSLYANLTGWMVILILGREFLISALRGYAESRKVKFGASGWGKRKMFLQSLTAGVILLNHAFFPKDVFFRYLLTALIWLTVVITFLSGIIYIYRAKALLGGEKN